MSQSTSENALNARPKAMIVGASSGIGAALAKKLAAEGYKVALLARRLEKLEQTRDMLNQRYGADTAFAVQHDVLDYATVPQVLQDTAAMLGGLDLFIYNSGTQTPTDPEKYDAAGDINMINVNVNGAIAWLNPVAERFQKAGEGHLVGIGSVAGDRGRRGMPGYGTSKAALHAYLEALRNRVRRDGVTVTTIKPGQIDTEMLRENADKVRGAIPVEQGADLIYAAIAKKRQVAYIPFKWAIVGLIIQHIPSFVFHRLNI